MTKIFASGPRTLSCLDDAGPGLDRLTCIWSALAFSTPGLLSVDVAGRPMLGIKVGIELRTGNFDKRGTPDVDFA